MVAIKGLLLTVFSETMEYKFYKARMVIMPRLRQMVITVWNFQISVHEFCEISLSHEDVFDSHLAINVKN